MLKYMSIFTPDGIILILFGPLEGRRAEMVLFRECDSCLQEVKIKVTRFAYMVIQHIFYAPGCRLEI
jgi:hypothetical protein